MAGRTDAMLSSELWEQARELVAMEENPEAGQLPNPSGTDPARQDVEEAAIQEKLR